MVGKGGRKTGTRIDIMLHEMIPDRLVLQPLSGTAVYFHAKLAPRGEYRDNTQRFASGYRLCFNPVAINGRDLSGSGNEFHIWLDVPYEVYALASDEPNLQLRGFADVLIYQRARGSLAYGLAHPRDLEVSVPAKSPWHTLLDAFPRPSPKPVSVKPTSLEVSVLQEQKKWLLHYSRSVEPAHRNYVVYKKQPRNLFDTDYYKLLNDSLSLIKQGQLPPTWSITAIYHLLGLWDSPPPRHLRPSE